MNFLYVCIYAMYVRRLSITYFARLPHNVFQRKAFVDTVTLLGSNMCLEWEGGYS